jgi:putative RecB family exonuclease
VEPVQESLDIGPVPYDYPKYLSPSSISTFQQCPLKFKFSKLDRLPSESTEAQVLGSFVHEILEELFTYPRAERTEATARKLGAELWTSKWGQEFEDLNEKSPKNEFRWKAWWCVENYFNMEDPTSFDATGIEAKMEGDIDGVPIFGIIDRYSVEDDKLVISDYKTGKKPRKQYEWEKKMQITIYSILLKQQTGMDIGRAELLYVKSGQFARYNVDADLENSVRVEVKHTWDQVKTMCDSGEFETRTGPLCNWCDYKHLCPEWN